MLRFVLARFGAIIPVLIGVTLVVFLSLQLVPGDIALTLLGRFANAEQLETLRRHLGLDQPLLVQYADWFMRLVQGDLGDSLAQKIPVALILIPKVANSLILMAGSLILVIAFGFGLSVLAAANFRGPADRVIVFVSLILASLPVFWLGLVLLYVFGVKWKLFPISGMYDMIDPGGLGQLLHHIVIPAVTTAASSIAIVTRVTRSRLIDVLHQPYILACTARGLSRRRVVLRHGVRNSLATFANIGGLQIGYLFGGVIFSEIIFNWPGIGMQLYESILQRDAPMIQGCVLAVAVVFVLGNLISDVIVHALDTTRR
ncbi:MAG: ABC transporter permease [Alphaproteobacteria bacterium]|nr:ABC transporter permease [Alphaproteobacteria bacterium]